MGGVVKVLKGNRTRVSLIISLALHGILILILALYISNITERLQDFVSISFHKIPSPRRRVKFRKPAILPKPALAPTDEYSPVAKPKGQREMVALKDEGIPVGQTEMMEPPRNMVIRRTGNPPNLVGRVDILTVVDLPSISDISIPKPASTLSTPTSGSGLGMGGGGRGGIRVGRGGYGGERGGGVGGGDSVPGLSSFVRGDGSASTSEVAKDMTEGVRLGEVIIPPLPKGEPGGRVVGRGKDIKGVFRFTRLKHRFSDWWADPISLVELTKWLNTHTNIRTDMNVEGGVLSLTDSLLMKSPMVVMTGHDPAFAGVVSIRSGRKVTTEPSLSDAERSALRKYLVERGGLIFFDECGHDILNTPLARRLIAELRRAVPEYPVMPIPNDHELFSCFYELGGPPIGASYLWIHGPFRFRGRMKRGLRGLEVGDELRVIISVEDYLCAIASGGHKKVRSEPAFRLITNVVVYSLTHGGISEHWEYVPEIREGFIPRRTPSIPAPTPKETLR
jgi:hypothetical protein